jgi:hypothetical protein
MTITKNRCLFLVSFKIIDRHHKQNLSVIINHFLVVTSTVDWTSKGGVALPALHRVVVSGQQRYREVKGVGWSSLATNTWRRTWRDLSNGELWFTLVAIFQTGWRVASSGMDMGCNGGALHAFYGGRRRVDRRSFKVTFLGGGGAPVCGRLMGGNSDGYRRGMGDGDSTQLGFARG